MKHALLSLSVLALMGTASMAAQAPQPACRGAQYRALDFWVGDWDLAWQGGVGTNHITRTYDGCVIEEHFDGQPSQHLQGHSVSVYDSRLRAWRQTWVDNEGGYIDLRGGPQPGGNFVLTSLRLTDKAPHARMVFEAIKPDSFVWRWQKSDDGKTWSDQWVINYKRKTSG